MKNKIIKHIETLITEHEQEQYCTDWNKVLKEENTEQAKLLAYEYGQYAILNQLLDDIDTLKTMKG